MEGSVHLHTGRVTGPLVDAARLQLAILAWDMNPAPALESLEVPNQTATMLTSDMSPVKKDDGSREHALLFDDLVNRPGTVLTAAPIYG